MCRDVSACVARALHQVKNNYNHCSHSNMRFEHLLTRQRRGQCLRVGVGHEKLHTLLCKEFSVKKKNAIVELVSKDEEGEACGARGGGTSIWEAIMLFTALLPAPPTPTTLILLQWSIKPKNPTRSKLKVLLRTRLHMVLRTLACRPSCRTVRHALPLLATVAARGS